MNDLALAYEYPIGSTDDEKNRIIVEYENRSLSECLRNLNR